MPWRKRNRLRTIAEQNADPATRGVYDEIKSALGLPALQLYYPALGAFPRFLALHWDSVRHVAERGELFAHAECMRAEAYTRAHNYFRVPDLGCAARTRENSDQLLQTANYFHYRDPLILLLFLYQLQAMEGPAGKPPNGAAESPGPSRPSQKLLELPASIAEPDASPQLRNQYDEIRRTLAAPFVPPEFCAFATHPEFLHAFWQALKTMLASPLYPACKHGLRSSAWALASQLPGAPELSLDRLADAGLTAEDVTSVARILDLLADSLCGSLLHVAAAKISLEGGNLVPAERARARQPKQPAA